MIWNGREVRYEGTSLYIDERYISFQGNEGEAEITKVTKNGDYLRVYTTDDVWQLDCDGGVEYLGALCGCDQ